MPVLCPFSECRESLNEPDLESGRCPHCTAEFEADGDDIILTREPDIESDFDDEDEVEPEVFDDDDDNYLAGDCDEGED
jgi:hypothetical protein